MELVDVATYYPGCCCLGGGHEKLVDFQRAMPPHNGDGRMYVSQQLIADAAALMGMKPRDEYDRVVAQLREAQVRLMELDEVRDQLRKLRACVRATLDAGATVDQRTGEHKLRLARGVKREEVQL